MLSSHTSFVCLILNAMLLEAAEITPPVFEAINLSRCVNGPGEGGEEKEESQVGNKICLHASFTRRKYMK